MDIDYYKKESKIKEFLDILRPPVKRYCRKSYQDYIGYVINADNTVKREKNIFAQHKSKKTISQRAVKSSLSLVLQKTCDRKIIEHPYSSRKLESENQTDESNTNITPTIKVTVIPKKDPNSLFEYLDTKNQSTKQNKKDNTLYNAENSIATKNVYLVVAGTNKDKIYEIKTTANKTSRNKTKDVRIDSKRFPMKMEKKKKKSFNVEGKIDENKCTNDCFCRSSKEGLDLSLEDEYPSGSSRVRIVGRIGLNEDDKYVMKCEATVNGQPVKNYAPAQIPIPIMPESIFPARRDIKADTVPSIHFNLSNHKFIDHTGESTTSHATQVDASIQITRLCQTTDRNTQCNLCELCNNTENSNFDDESKGTNLNRSTSPLVIISVYPKPELSTYALNPVDTTLANRFDVQTYRPTQLNETVRSNNFAVNTDLYNVREPPQDKANIPRCCPCENTVKNDTKTTKDDTKTTNQNITRKNKTSRSPSPAKKSHKSKTQERKKDTTETKNTAMPKSRSPSPNRVNTNDKVNQRETNLSKQTKKASASTKKADTKKQIETLRSSKARDKSVNTAREQSDKISKKVTENIRRSNQNHTQIKNDLKSTRHETVLKKNLPKNEISKVSINIDSEREYYDVVFEKGMVSTDLMVRRTAKDNYSQKYFEETYEQNYERTSDSLENFFPVPDSGEHRRSASQTFNNDNNDAFPLSTANASRLNVRDSLEINHRREHDHSRDSKSHASKNSSENDTVGDNEGDFYAPEKHFPGDECIIDPIERDREIRKLLGIDKNRRDKKHTDTFEHKMYRNNVISRRSIYRNTVCKSLAKKPTLHWSYSACTENIQNDNMYIPRDEEKSITDDEKHNLIKLSTYPQIIKRNVNRNTQTRVNIAATTKQQSKRCQCNATTTKENAGVTFLEQSQDMLNLQCSSRDINPELKKKQTPILLSGKQYRKIKKLMHKVNGDWKKGRHIWNSSIVSLASLKTKCRNEYLIHYNKNIQTDPPFQDFERFQSSKTSVSKKGEDKKTVVLFCKEETDKFNDGMSNEVKRMASSIEIRYTSIAFSNVGEHSIEHNQDDIKYRSNLLWKRRDSIETIFKGRKRSFTPNLGISSLSLLSEEVKSTAESLPTESKPRKPFLRRLMSCLVMRSETTAVKMPVMKQKQPTLDSSVDSYHISSSLGAMDMSSSIYDTSTSFYSNHTIGAINNKTKRGFFSSVREFLSTKKN